MAVTIAQEIGDPVQDGVYPQGVPAVQGGELIEVEVALAEKTEWQVAGGKAVARSDRSAFAI